MNSKIDREKLTAYVLGELDEQERKNVKAALAADEALRKEVDEIRAAADLTRELFAGAPELSLSDEQRETIASRAAEAGGGQGADVVELKKPARRLNWPILRAAAVVLVVIGAGAIAFYPQFEDWRQGAPLFVEFTAKDAGRRALDAGKNQVPRSAAAHGQRDEGTETEAVAVEESIENLIEAHDQIVDGPAPDPDAQPAEVKEAAPAQQQAEPMDAKTRESLKSLGYMGDEAHSVTAHAPVVGVKKSGVTPSPGRMMAGSASEHRRVATGGAGHVPPVREKREKFGYEMDDGSSYIDDPDLNHWPGHDTEAYDRIVDNPFKGVGENPLSTFSIDVDTASYSNMRRFINSGRMPPKDAVRIEELVNYFDYDYEPPRGNTPFSAHVAVAGCPWNPDHRLARVGLKGWEMSRRERPASNFVFLLDVSGSMSSVNKLPLLKQAMGLLVQQLDRRDRVSIVVYAGASGLILEATPGSDGRVIMGALDRLQAGGSTNGGAGIELAYDLAVRHFIKGGVNRVILATDGDFNVGTTSRGDLVRMIEKKAKSGVFLTVLGFGMGNYKDATMENLADKGNGNYAYIDTIREAKKVLVDELGATMVTIAKDVKIQVEFNPAEVQAYRLIGYENRILAAEDFNDDTKDAGEIGAGHTVTALYELVPPGVELDLPNVDPLKYQKTTKPSREARGGELFTIKLRYKEQDGDTSKLLSFPVSDSGTSYASAPPDFKFAAAVASFGMILRDSEHRGQSDIPLVLELGEDGLGRDVHGYRAEFLELVRKARSLER